MWQSTSNHGFLFNQDLLRSIDSLQRPLVHLLNRFIADLRQLAIAKLLAAAIMFQESKSVKYLEIEPAIDELG